MILTGHEQLAKSGKATSIMVMLHGVGSNGANMMPLVPMLADAFPDTHFFAPNAPEPYEFAEAGAYQWFPYWERSHAQIVEGAEKAGVIVARYLAELSDRYDIRMEKIILLGFSQGSMTAIQTALTMQDDIAAVLSFSGGLIKVDISEFEVRSTPPMCLIHGEEDDVVPVQTSYNSTNMLIDHGVEAEFHSIPNLAHSINMAGLEAAKAFLKKIIV